MEEPRKVKLKHQLVKGPGRCGACQRVQACERKIAGRKGARKQVGFECAVLLRMIGQVKECSFFTDDPEWEEKVRQEVRFYYRKRGDGSACHHVG